MMYFFPVIYRRIFEPSLAAPCYNNSAHESMQIRITVEDLQPYATLITAVFSVATLGLVVNVFRLARDAAQERVKVFEDRLAGAKEEQERTEKWHVREKERLEKELEDRKQQLDGILIKAGINPEALVFGPSLVSVADDARKQIGRLVDEMRDRLAALPEEGGVSDNQAAATLVAARGEMVRGRWESAASLFDTYSQQDGDGDWATQFSRGVAHANARGGDSTDLAALRAYNDAIALAPVSLEPNLRARMFGYRGAILKRLRRLEEAESDLRIAQRLASDSYEKYDVLYNLACVYAMKDERGQLLETLKKLQHNSVSVAMIRRHLHDYFLNFRDDPEVLGLIGISRRT